MAAPTTGVTAKEELAGPGAGASAAKAEVAETAATRAAQAIFLISMVMAAAGEEMRKMWDSFPLLLQIYGLGSMSMEELFRSICDENAAALEADVGASVALKGVGGKTVEEVWRKINTGRMADGAEMTLEDFLARAGAVAEEDVGVPSGFIQAGCGTNPVVGETILPPPPPPQLPEDDLVVGFVNGAEGAASRNRGRKRPLLDPVDRVAMQRQKRMIKNRESAARSRERKQAYIAELESLAAKLEEENAQLLRSQEQQQRKRIKQLLENLVPVTQKKRERRPLRRTHSSEW